MDNNQIDHILVIGFGGPTTPEEIRPFLDYVTRGLRIPEARLREVLRHYEAVGGRSPYNEYTLRLFNKLEQRLRGRGIRQPMFLGMRNWHPFLNETMCTIRAQQHKHGLGVILAPHRCDASFEKYLRNVEEAKAATGAESIKYTYLKPWHDHPLFIEAQADEVRRTMTSLGAVGQPMPTLVFTAHSVPAEMARCSRYAEEIETSSAAVAESLGQPRWRIAYQSRSGHPSQPWLQPDVETVIRELKARGERGALLVPIGFLCDNVEVLFDLDIEARKDAQRLGFGYARASTVMDHPKFVEMFSQLISAALN